MTAGETTHDGDLERARRGDGRAFQALTGPYRRELLVHCYRIVGSAQDAEDLVQDTLLAAWRTLDRFEGRSSLRTWLYRIATHRSLNAVRDHGRRPENRVPPEPELPLPEPTRLAGPSWLEPLPDVLDVLADQTPGPEARYESRESVSLAFVAALQTLPPRQRAVLVLRDVLGFRTTEAAAILGCSQDSVAGALKRARATLAEHPPARTGEAPFPDSPAERTVLDAFVRAFEGGDVDRVVALLTDDAWLTMPPLPCEYQGHDAIGHFLRTMGFLDGTRRFRLIATRANGQPAFGCYVRDPRSSVCRAHGVLVLTLHGERISVLTRFLDNGLLQSFGLPRTVRLDRAGSTELS